MSRSGLLGLLLATGLAISGCGSSSPASSPLTTALSYFPKDSPFVMSVATNPRSSAVKGGQATLHGIPLATFGQAALIARLQALGINYDSDIRPLFGNPLLVGLAGPATPGSVDTRPLVVWVTKDASALASLISALHLKQTQTYDGATLYGMSSTAVAVDRATLLVGASAQELMSALDLRAHGGGLSFTDYDSELAGLPKNSLLEAFGYLGGVLSKSGAANARRVAWVSALRGYGVSISAGSNGLTFQYRLDTSGAALSPAELPLAPGSAPPALAGNLPILVGLREPATTLSFLLDVERVSSPMKYAADLAAMNAVRRKTGVDFDRDVLGQLGTGAMVESDGRSFMVRVDVKSPGAAARTLRRLGTSALDIAETHPGARVTLGPGSFETAHRPHGPSILFGLVGGEFVAGTATPAHLRAFAGMPAPAAAGAQGALAFQIALPELLRVVLKHAPSRTIQLVLSQLGDITGWTSSSAGALTGSATLSLR